MRPPTRRGEHSFGGDWTTLKLEILADYLHAYTTALKNTRFKKAFVDAFAGTGYRIARREAMESDSTQALLLPDLAEAAPQDLLDGSARIALRTEQNLTPTSSSSGTLIAAQNWKN